MSNKLLTENEFESFISEDNFHLAWSRILSSTIFDTKDRLGLKIFSAQTSEHLEILRQDMCQNVYKPSAPIFIYGPKDDKTFRIRTFLEIRDRIIYQAIGNIIIQKCYDDIIKHADKTIFAHIPTQKKSDGSYTNFTFRPTFSKGKSKGQYNKFIDTVYLDIKKSAKLKNIWVLETDISSFYPSVDHKLLCET